MTAWDTGVPVGSPYGGRWAVYSLSGDGYQQISIYLGQMRHQRWSSVDAPGTSQLNPRTYAAEWTAMPRISRKLIFMYLTVGQFGCDGRGLVRCGENVAYWMCRCVSSICMARRPHLSTPRPRQFESPPSHSLCRGRLLGSMSCHRGW